MSFILALLLLCPLPPPPPGRAVAIVYVARPGSPFPGQAQTRAAIQSAIDYWQVLAPEPILLAITSERTITIDGDIEENYEWSLPYWSAPPTVTLFMLDTDRPLGGDRPAFAMTRMDVGVIWSVRGEGDWLAAILAHEIGHAAYRLPEQYQDADDIMGLAPIWAYQQRHIGCASLAILGHPCMQVWLPMISFSPTPTTGESSNPP